MTSATPQVNLPELDRTEFQKHLSSTQNLEHKDPRFFHGRAYTGPGADQAPEVTWQSKALPRDDHGSTADWLTATEFCDHPDVIDAKSTMLAQLIRLSNKTVVYSGAGISVPALIGQAAKGSGGKGSKSSDAWPTKTHFALGTLGRHKMLHGWVQQNHDGLPQKAGFPQENINEIHGSWFDPSNPVVLYSGTLKDDCYPWMEHDAETADLVIVVGTSLGGLNADQVATKTARRSLRNKPWKADGSGGALGTVIINLQQTEQDGKATLRMFGTTDSILPRVLEKLGMAEVSKCKCCGKKFCREPNGYMYRGVVPRGSCSWDLSLLDEQGTMRPTTKAQFTGEKRTVIVPYDQDGKRSQTTRMVLDLRDGQGIKITEGHNIQGAGQPSYLHIGAKKPYTRPARYGGQTLQPGPGHGKVNSFCAEQSSFKLSIHGVMMTLGAWWLDAAERGELETLPIVNLKPVMKPVEAKKTTVPRPVVATAAATTSAVAPSAAVPDTDDMPGPAPTIEVGNVATKSATQEDTWDWRVYVKGPTVSEVTFHLHPTFNPSKVTRKPDEEGCCSLGCSGWGTFDIQCDITLQDGTTLQKGHSLVFKESGSRKIYQL